MKEIVGTLLPARSLRVRNSQRVCLSICLLLTSSQWAFAELKPAPVDSDHVDWLEDLSEELANQLHELSLAVRIRQVDDMSTHLAAQLRATPWPQFDTGEPQGESKWVDFIATSVPGGTVDREAFLDSWQRFLDGFADIEDVRFKVKQAHFETSDRIVEADASVYMSLIGRDARSRRVWVEAKAHATFARGSDAKWWLLAEFEFGSFVHRVAKRDLFDEVALSAGVYEAAPPFGSPGNPGFGARGVAAGDVDGDGLLDAVVTSRTGVFLYINRGDGTFDNSADAAGVGITPQASSPLLVDVDNDGDVDLFLAAPGEQMLFENRLVPDGRLELVDVSSRAGVDRLAQGHSAAAADVNGDGFADIHVASYNRYGLVMPNSWSRATNGTNNLLFVNRGDGTFDEAAVSWEVADSRWSYAAHFADLNGDGRQDLYLANDFGENALYINEGGRFRDAAAELGLLDPGNGMGVSLGDYDNDGRLDIHVTNMSSTAGKRILERLFPNAADQLDETRVLNKLAAGNSVFRNMGNGAFEEVSARLGPFSAGWAWGGGFIDFDNDGWEDIHTPNGFVSGKSLKDT